MEIVPTQKDLLNLNYGNVLLFENKDQTQFRFVRTTTPLPSVPQSSTEFDNNAFYQEARQRENEFVVLLSEAGTVLVVPTQSYASIKDFCKRAPHEVYTRLWNKVFAVRRKLESKYGDKFYIETIRASQFHVRILGKTKPVYTSRTMLWLSSL